MADRRVPNWWAWEWLHRNSPDTGPYFRQWATANYTRKAKMVAPPEPPDAPPLVASEVEDLEACEEFQPPQQFRSVTVPADYYARLAGRVAGRSRWRLPVTDDRGNAVLGQAGSVDVAGADGATDGRAADPRGQTHRYTWDGDTLVCECGDRYRDAEEFGTAEERHARHVVFRAGLQP